MTSGNNNLQSQEAYPHLNPIVGLFDVIDISRNPITKELKDFFEVPLNLLWSCEKLFEGSPEDGNEIIIMFI